MNKQLRTRRNSWLAASVIFLLPLTTSILHAQEVIDQPSSINEDRGRSRGALYFLTPDDRLAIRVNVWGFVAKPGQYVVPKDTDLISMISYAGGPIQDAKLKTVHLIRGHAFELAGLSGNVTTNRHDDYNGQNGKNGRKDTQRQVMVVNVKKYMTTGDEQLIPELLPGDTIVVPGSKLHALGRFLDFAAKLAMLTQIYFYIKVAND